MSVQIIILVVVEFKPSELPSVVSLHELRSSNLCCHSSHHSAQPLVQRTLMKFYTTGKQRTQPSFSELCYSLIPGLYK